MFHMESNVYVRARLKDGQWASGWFGVRSFASTFPEPESLSLERACEVSDNGEFLQSCRALLAFTFSEPTSTLSSSSSPH
jgi:hypothetical protein